MPVLVARGLRKRKRRTRATILNLASVSSSKKSRELLRGRVVSNLLLG